MKRRTKVAESISLTALAWLAVSLVAPSPAAAGDSPSLFSTVLVDPPVSPPGRYLGTYSVVPNLEEILPPAQTITLNLPGLEPEVVELRHWEPRSGYIQIPDPNDPTGLGTITIPDPSAGPNDFSWRWYGKSANYTVALTVVKGVLAGRVAGTERRYFIQPRYNGHTRLGIVNSEFWRTHADDGADVEKTVRATATPPTLDQIVAFSQPLPASPIAPRGSGWNAACDDPLPTAPQVIDVLMLYTQGTLNITYGGNVAAVNAVMQLVLDNANQSLRNSGIQNVVFSPRGPELLPNPTSPAFNYDTSDIVAARDRLSGTTTLDQAPYYLFPGNSYIEGRRNTMWADIVTLARLDLTGEATCGVAFPNRIIVNNGYPTEPGPAFERFAYAVFDPDCDADRLNFAHELGHLMGMEHDPRNFGAWDTPGHSPSCLWSHGHKRLTGDQRFRFRTVMSYWQNAYGGNGGPPSCGSDANCPLIDAYSTPLLEWAGDPGSGGTPPFGLQPVGTVAGASPIGIVGWAPAQYPAHNADTIRRIAPIAAAYRARPDPIFANGFQ